MKFGRPQYIFYFRTITGITRRDNVANDVTKNYLIIEMLAEKNKNKIITNLNCAT